MESALAVLEGRTPERPFITGASLHQPCLAARTRRAGPGLARTAARPESAGRATRLVGAVGQPARRAGGHPADGAAPGPRGWGKLRELPLSRLLRDDSLPPQDLRLARRIRASVHESSGGQPDLAQAIVALVGHPLIEFDDAPA